MLKIYACAAALAVACGCRAGTQDRTETPAVDGSGGDATEARGSWLDLTSNMAPAGRSGHSAVWTGSLMLIFGGEGGSSSGQPYADGGVYSATPPGWRELGTTNAPAARSFHTAVWTTGGMIVWGGFLQDWNTGSPTPTATGGVYDPASGQWQTTSLHDAPEARHGHTAVSTGSKMLVWGGSGDVPLDSGGLYDPVTDSWQPTATDGAPTARFGHSAVWTGKVMIVWGGVSTTLEATGAAYDPATDTWTPLPTIGAPAARKAHTAVWAGGRMVVFGGIGMSSDGQTEFLNSGGVYDPETRAWTPISTAGAPLGRSGHSAVSTGGAMIVYGGRGADALFSNGGIYLPATDSWLPLAGGPDGTYRTGHTAVWTGDSMVVWGGYSSLGHYLATGSQYRLPPAATSTETASP